MDYSKLFRLDGRKAMVIGAGSGIGREAALALAAQGATVVCADRNLEAATETSELAGSLATAYALDVTDLEAVTGRRLLMIDSNGVMPLPPAKPR